MKKLLIVVDMQNDFIDGTLGTKEAQAIMPNVKAKIEEYRNQGYDIIFTRDTHFDTYLCSQEGKKLPVEHCISGTTGWEIAEALCADRVRTMRTIDKLSFGYNGWSDYALYRFDEIELCGLCTDICVVSNALIIKACVPETPITVDARCCAGVTPETHQAALTTMKMCQINVIGE